MSFGQRSPVAPMTSLNLMPDFARDLRNQERAQWQALPASERMSRAMAQVVAFFDYRKDPDQAPFRIALAAIGVVTLWASPMSPSPPKPPSQSNKLHHLLCGA